MTEITITITSLAVYTDKRAKAEPEKISMSFTANNPEPGFLRDMLMGAMEKFRDTYPTNADPAPVVSGVIKKRTRRTKAEIEAADKPQPEYVNDKTRARHIQEVGKAEYDKQVRAQRAVAEEERKANGPLMIDPVQDELDRAAAGRRAAKLAQEQPPPAPEEPAAPKKKQWADLDPKPAEEDPVEVLRRRQREREAKLNG